MPAVFSAPSKVFVLGEYAVLSGRPALLAAMGPRFELSSEPFAGSTRVGFHPASAAARLAPASQWSWLDPYEGAGGFGASSAQALLVMAVQGDWKSTPSAKEAASFRPHWERFKTLSPGSSGADFVVQALGGVLEWSPEDFSATDRSSSLSRIRIRVLQASHQLGRKTATHHHLEELGPSRLEQIARELEPTLRSGLAAFASGDARAFAGAIGDYADRLAALDLEDGTTRLDRHALSAISGVLGSKGTGALQSDALVVVVDPATLDEERFAGEVARLGLMDRGELPQAEPGVMTRALQKDLQ